MLSPDLIREAAHVLDGNIRMTPVEESPVLSERLGVPVFLKLENWQITGSFKVRGAWFVLSKLKLEGVDAVATCSAGNHGKGVAWAAAQLGVKATIFVPKSVDASKYEDMVRLGAAVEKSAFDGYDDTEAWALEESRRRGLPFVSAYDDEKIMAANGGTVALEVAQQVPEATEFVMPLGGGGHSGGFAFHMKEARPDARIHVCQHRDSAGFLRSIEAGKPVTELPPIDTLASGLEGGFGVRTFEILKGRYDTIQLVSEDELMDAMRWMARHHRMIVEGSSAVAIAACLQEDFPSVNGPVVVFISGRNVAIETVARILNQA